MEPDHVDPSPAPSSDAPRRARALARLRDRVEAAATEIERLRAENARLAERVKGLGEGGPGVPVAGDPAELRASIQSFIDAIDRVLDAPDS